MVQHVFEYQVEEARHGRTATKAIRSRHTHIGVCKSPLPLRGARRKSGFTYLMTAKIIGDICIEATGSLGKPDFVTRNDAQQLSMVAESKSTHNLLLPTTASDLVDKYKAAYDDVVTNQAKRTQEWAHIAHPIAQLVGYMVDNKCRYGALTSGTRTYFLYISDSNAATTVHISGPFFVGEESYLRAWAYVHSLGCEQRDTFKIPTSTGKRKWLKFSRDQPTPQKEPNDKGPRSTGGSKNNKRKHGGAGSSTQSNKRTKKTKTAIEALDLPHVDFHDMIFGKKLGFGRNGSVFEVAMAGKTICIEAV